MNESQIQLIKSSWSEIISSNASAGEYFYKQLFELDPSLEALFKGDIKEQARKFVSMITFISFKLDNFEVVLQEANELGKRHKHYSVPPSSYATVEKALMSTLAYNLKTNWTKETEEAWSMVYGKLKDAMLQPAA